MANRNRDLARRDTGAAASGSGQVTRLAGLVTLARRGGVVHRVVPAHLACRIGARTRAGERNAWSASRTTKRPHRQVPAEHEPAQHEHAEVRGRTEAVTTGRNCHA